MSPRDKFLSLVDHKTTGRDHGVFRVPTRRDRTMSGTWRELDDGRLLIHDFGGEPTQNTVACPQGATEAEVRLVWAGADVEPLE